MRTEQVLHMDLWGISTNSKYNFMQGEKIMFFTLTKQICLWSTAFPHWQVVWDPNGRELFITWGGGDIVCCAKFCQEVLHLYTGGQTGGGGGGTGACDSLCAEKCLPRIELQKWQPHASHRYRITEDKQRAQAFFGTDIYSASGKNSNIGRFKRRLTACCVAQNGTVITKRIKHLKLVHEIA